MMKRNILITLPIVTNKYFIIILFNILNFRSETSQPFPVIVSIYAYHAEEKKIKFYFLGSSQMVVMFL